MLQYGRQLTCDRCGKKEFYENQSQDGWGNIPSRMNPKAILGSNVCPDCYRRFTQMLELYYTVYTDVDIEKEEG